MDERDGAQMNGWSLKANSVRPLVHFIAPLLVVTHVSRLVSMTYVSEHVRNPCRGRSLGLELDLTPSAICAKRIAKTAEGSEGLHPDEFPDLFLCSFFMPRPTKNGPIGRDLKGRWDLNKRPVSYVK
jgi:hypothetical protein